MLGQRRTLLGGMVVGLWVGLAGLARAETSDGQRYAALAIQNHQVVDLLAERDAGQGARLVACPEAAFADAQHPPCRFSGQVERVQQEPEGSYAVCQTHSVRHRREPMVGSAGWDPECPVVAFHATGSRLRVVIDGTAFYFLHNFPNSQPLSSRFFALVEQTRTPLEVEFVNWGGKFYITNASASPRP